MNVSPFFATTLTNLEQSLMPLHRAPASMTGSKPCAPS